jgi:hypothetical protein
MTETALIEEIKRMPLSEVYKVEMYARQIRLSKAGHLSASKGSRIRSRKRFRIDEDSTELIKKFRD